MYLPSDELATFVSRSRKTISLISKKGHHITHSSSQTDRLSTHSSSQRDRLSIPSSSQKGRLHPLPLRQK